MQEDLFLNLQFSLNCHTPCHIGKNRVQCDENDVINQKAVWTLFERERDNRASDTDLVLKSVGLEPLNVYSTMAEIKRHLGLQTISKEIMLAETVRQYNAKIVQSL